VSSWLVRCPLQGSLRVVSVFRYECSAKSPDALLFSWPGARLLSLEDALVVAILVDAYVPLRRFIFSLR
jgi:hypothetical protein